MSTEARAIAATQAGTAVKTEEAFWWLFRIFVMWEFVGHGSFGIITKPEWTKFFAVVGIGEAWAFKLMPVVGTFDVIMGVTILFIPIRAILAWMAIWGVWTALLRPLSGTSWTEFFERAYNYGYPFAFLYVAGFGKNLKEWFTTKIEHKPLTNEQIKFLKVFFQISIATYLLGHAGFGLIDAKAGLIKQYDAVGITALFGGDSMLALKVIGAFEAFLAVLVLFAPTNAVLITICVWKMSSEMLFPLSGAFWGGWEFIERGSSYAMPIALLLINKLAREKSDA